MKLSAMFVLAGIGLATAGIVGCLYLSFGLSLTPCPLCITQRVFLMGVFAVLTVGMLVARKHPGALSAASLPLAVSGLGVAGYHTLLVVNGTLECPPGVLGIATFPAQSFALFVLLTVTSAAGVWAAREQLSKPLAAFVGSVVLGLFFAWVTVASAPPIPDRTTPYDPETQPLRDCRPAHKPAQDANVRSATPASQAL